LTRRVPVDLVDDMLDQPRIPLAGAQHDQAGQRRQQRSADLGRRMVRPGEQHRGAVRIIAPRPQPERTHRPCAGHAGQRPANLVRADRYLRRRFGAIGDRVRVGTAHDRHIAGHDVGRRRARVDVRRPANHRHERQRRLVLDADRPGRGQQRAQDESSPCPRVEQATQRIHAVSVDARVCNQVPAAWIISPVCDDMNV